ncbi:MAG: EAL domain-containing protein [Porticoccaceae bacterium]
MSDSLLGPGFPIISADNLALRVLAGQAHGVAVLDGQRVVAIWNDWLGQWSGRPAEQAVGRELWELYPALVDSEFSQAVAAALQEDAHRVWTPVGEPQLLRTVATAMTRGGAIVAPLQRIRVSPLPLPTGPGCLIEFGGAVAGAPFLQSPQQPADLTLVPVAERFPGYIESADLGVLIVDEAGLIRDINQRMTDITAYARDQLLNQPVWVLFPAWETSSSEEDYRALRTLRQKQKPELHKMLTADGLNLDMSVVVYPSAVRAEHLVLGCQDVSRHQAAKGALVRQRALLSAIYGQVADGIVLVDAQGLVEQINPMGASLLGLHAGQGIGEPVGEVLSLVDGRSGDRVPLCREALARGSVIFTRENCQLKRDDHEAVPITATATPLRDSDGQLTGCVLVFRTQGEALSEGPSRVSWQSIHDPLTQLPNRRYLESEIVRAIKTAKTGARTHTLLYIDLYNFSLINDTCGQAAGDALLRECGRLLRQHVDLDNMVARIGNDEFAVLLMDCPPAEGRDTAEAILAEIKAFSFPWGERRLKIGANIGAEVIDRNTSSEIDALVVAASSCAAAKDLGRNQVHFQYHREDISRRKRVAEWIPRITEALDDDRFCLHYQPIVPLGASGRIGKHFEALVRMLDRRGQIIAPGRFIPAAEHYGLIDDIDRWVIDRVIKTLCGLTRRQRKDLRISVNLSGLTIGDEGFRDWVLNRLDEAVLDPSHLQFEITETAAIRQFDKAMDLIHVLKAKGCYFSLDDFGSGLSSFAYLKQLPVDYLKIDGAFVRNMELSKVDFSMVSTINHLAHVMDITTVAESVENQAQLTMLEELGVDHGQGFFLTPPKPLEAFI